VTSSAETGAVVPAGTGRGTSAGYAVQVLRDRADSFWRDAAVLDRDGDSVMAVAYWAVAAELRLTADILETGEHG